MEKLFLARLILRTMLHYAYKGVAVAPTSSDFFLPSRKLPKKSRIQSLRKKKLRFSGRSDTFFPRHLIFVLFCAARWWYMKFLLLMSHCKIKHSLLILYIQKNFNTTSKTVYIYVFSLFFFRINSGKN